MAASGKDAMRWDRSGFAADLGKPLFGTVVMESKKKTVMELDTEVKLQAFMAKLCEAVPHISMCGLHSVEQSKKLFSPPHRQPSTIDCLSLHFQSKPGGAFLIGSFLWFECYAQTISK